MVQHYSKKQCGIRIISLLNLNSFKKRDYFLLSQKKIYMLLKKQKLFTFWNCTLFSFRKLFITNDKNNFYVHLCKYRYF